MKILTFNSIALVLPPPLSRSLSLLLFVTLHFEGVDHSQGLVSVYFGEVGLFLNSFMHDFPTEMSI